VDAIPKIFRKRSDVNVVVHSHPLHASIYSAVTEPLQPFTLDADYFVEVPRHEADVALLVQKSEGQALARTLGKHWAIFIANHGVTFCGTTIEHAVCVGVFLEKACKAQLIARAADMRRSMPKKVVRARRHAQIMTPVHWEHCWHYFCRKLEARGQAAIFG